MMEKVIGPMPRSMSADTRWVSTRANVHACEWVDYIQMSQSMGTFPHYGKTEIPHSKQKYFHSDGRLQWPGSDWKSEAYVTTKCLPLKVRGWCHIMKYLRLNVLPLRASYVKLGFESVGWYCLPSMLSSHRGLLGFEARRERRTRSFYYTNFKDADVSPNGIVWYCRYTCCTQWYFSLYLVFIIIQFDVIC